MKHAKYSPSKAAQIIACPGSVQLQEQAPPGKPSAYAEEGSLAHAVAEALLLFEEPPAHDQAMADAVKVYVDEVDPKLDTANKYGIETTLQLDEDTYGTPDLWMLIGRALWVYDYKHGAGVRVSAERNRQMMTYAGLVLADETTGVTYEDVDHVFLVIVQPRAHDGGIDTYGCEPHVIFDHMKELDAAINSSKLHNPPIELGEHCRWCTAKLICPAMARAEAGVVAWDSRDLEPKQLSHLLADAKVLETRIKDLREYAQERAEAGEKIPGWKLVAKRARRKWRNEGEVLTWARSKRLYRKLMKEVLLSPAQVAKVVTEPQFDQLSEFITSESTGVTLVTDDDNRAEVDSTPTALTALGRRFNL